MSKSLELPVEENEKPIFFVLPRFERDQLHNRDIEKFSLSCMDYFQRDPASYTGEIVLFLFLQVPACHAATKTQGIALAT